MLKDRRSVSALIEHLKDGEPEIRSRSAESLGKIGDCLAIEPLISVINTDDHDEVQICAALALVHFGEAAIVPLIKNLGVKTGKCWLITMKALIDIGKPAVDALIKSLNDSTVPVKAGIIRILGEIEDKRAIEPLIELSKLLTTGSRSFSSY